MQTSLLYALSSVLWWIIPGTMAALVAYLSLQLLRGNAFAPLLPSLFYATALIVMIGGFAAQITGDMASSMAAAEALDWTGASWESADPDIDITSFWPEAGLHIEIPFWPFVAGLGFAALATLFRYGVQLQKDTAGLV